MVSENTNRPISFATLYLMMKMSHKIMTLGVILAVQDDVDVKTADWEE
jgi:hypothetical protein